MPALEKGTGDSGSPHGQTTPKVVWFNSSMNSFASNLIARLRPIIELLFASHDVSREQGRALIEELVRTLQLKRDSIADPEAWFVATLHRAVQQMEEQRRKGSAEDVRD